MLSARERVLNTPELICLILLNLDQRTILTVVQKVCKAWLYQIQSAPLQQHLFLRPSRAPQRPGPRILNPLLIKAFPAWFRTFSAALDGKVDPSELYINPQAMVQFQGSDLYALRGPKNPFLRKGATWLRMQVSDPPTTNVVFHNIFIDLPSGNEDSAESKVYHAGLQMGDLYFSTLRSLHTGRYGTGYFQVVWPQEGRIRRKHSVDALTRISRYWHLSSLQQASPKPQEIAEAGAELLILLGRVGDEPEAYRDPLWGDCGSRFTPDYPTARQVFAVIISLLPFLLLMIM
jgi:hypothetical protein